MADVLAGVRAYQAHPYRRALSQPAEAARIGNVRLLDYGGTGRPAVFVPSLVNPPTVLDLAAGNSLLRWLATQGVRPLLIDWGSPGTEERDLSLDGYIDERLLPLLDSLGDAAVVGYCLGGTMVLAAATARPPARLALIATPWRFAGYGDAHRAALATAWTKIDAASAPLGVVPMEMLQPLFWRLDPAGTAAKFERFGHLPPNSEDARAFVALEDWANDGPPLTRAAARQCFESFFAADAPGRGDWRPGAPACPVLNIVSTRDRIVPAATAPAVGHRLDLDAGHVGMIVGSQAQKKLWQPLRDWILG